MLGDPVSMRTLRPAFWLQKAATLLNTHNDESINYCNSKVIVILLRVHLKI